LTIAKDEIRLKFPELDNKVKEDIIEFSKYISDQLLNDFPTMRGKVDINANYYYVKLHNNSRTVFQEFKRDINVNS
ncbi:MAG TPA: hypothetical protein VKR58_08600, partial [Aquella sp.]|nr:hypothetical protein [Aquella sp.]